MNSVVKCVLFGSQERVVGENNGLAGLTIQEEGFARVGNWRRWHLGRVVMTLCVVR